mmetsp:Transcript_768/g.2288  ORF Transcript_768/g.2288 Transcript_768/m.2288 type:complete len:235 (-) Transcript_768:674-1378(-)
MCRRWAVQSRSPTGQTWSPSPCPLLRKCARAEAGLLRRLRQTGRPCLGTSWPRPPRARRCRARASNRRAAAKPPSRRRRPIGIQPPRLRPGLPGRPPLVAPRGALRAARRARRVSPRPCGSAAAAAPPRNRLRRRRAGKARHTPTLRARPAWAPARAAEGARQSRAATPRATRATSAARPSAPARAAARQRARCYPVGTPAAPPVPRPPSRAAACRATTGDEPSWPRRPRCRRA